MIRSLKIISFLIILFCVSVLLFFKCSQVRDINVQNEIIDSIFKIDVVDDDFSDESTDSIHNSIVSSFDSSFLGYIYIPKFNIKRLIKYGCDDYILNANYVGMHKLSGSLSGDDLIILAGHNISNVFSRLHSINVGDEVFINGNMFSRRFIVYDYKIVDEYDGEFLYNNRKNELLLITCTKSKGERFIVFLREDV